MDVIVAQRRFPRVFLTSVLSELHPLTDCKVIWPSGFQSDIFNVGRSSISFYVPMRLNLKFAKDEVVKLDFIFGASSEPLTLEGRVIRSETRLLTLELFRLTEGQRTKIRKFFDDSQIARKMFAVRNSDFAPEQTFSSWFHGPLDTNLYVFRDWSGIQRVVLELGDDVIVRDGKGLMAGPSRDTLSYPTEDYAYYANFLAPLSPIDARDKRFKRALGFLREIPSDGKVLPEVISFFESER